VTIAFLFTFVFDLLLVFS